MKWEAIVNFIEKFCVSVLKSVYLWIEYDPISSCSCIIPQLWTPYCPAMLAAKWSKVNSKVNALVTRKHETHDFSINLTIDSHFIFLSFFYTTNFWNPFVKVTAVLKALVWCCISGIFKLRCNQNLKREICSCYFFYMPFSRLLIWLGKSRKSWFTWR